MRIFAITIQPVAALAMTLIAFTAPAEASAPVGLLADGVSNPLAIDSGTVRFTWMCGDDHRGEKQIAYQILVASNPKQLATGEADWWDSGKVDTDKSASVEYGGKPLPPATRFWWKVRIWDQTGKASPYSAPAFFDTGLNQWTAHYIWDGTTNVNNFAYFRKTFVITNQPDWAKVYLTAHDEYLLYFNGKILGCGPARCDPYHYGQYNAYDITGLLKTGTNEFAAISHWHGLFNDSGVNAKPAFLLEARLDYPDGSSTTIGTDESWKVLAHTAYVETNAAYFSPVGKKQSRSNLPHR